MIERNIFGKIRKAFNSKMIIVITGLRRSGKTTTLKYLYDRVKSKNKVYIDFERMEYRKIFFDENYGNIIRSLELMGLDLSEKSYLFLDEVQYISNAASVIKYLYDSYDIKISVTGSSSFYMKDAFSESLAGRKILFELWPLGFDEFLRFKNEEVPAYFGDFNPVPQFYIHKYQPYYEEYLNFGGFPEVALLDNPEEKKALLNDILESFLQFDIKFLADFSKTDDVYKIVNLLSARTGSKIDYSKLSGISGINRHKVKDYLIFLEKAYFIRIIKPHVVNRDREIALQPKIYFTDNGILNIFGGISSGALFENSIANQLSLKGKLNYYARRNGQEIDFIFNGDTAIEVKETPSLSDHKTLSRRARSIGINNYFLAGRYSPAGDFTNFVYGGSF